MSSHTRTIRINHTYEPAISGYGGYDEWTLEDLPEAGIDEFNAALDKLVLKIARKYKVKGGWTGAT